MRYYFITFRSVTFAQRGERLLRRAGIDAVLQRATRMMEDRGCGYSLQVRQRDGAEAMELLRQAQVPFRRVYVRGPEGKMEEVAL